MNTTRKTLVDKSIRGMEIPAEAVELSDSFQDAVERAADKIAEELGLAREHLNVERYKLLLYQKGGFFLPHRDSEKRRGMVATFVVVLPSKFGGGELVVTHEGRREIFAFNSARAEQDTEYVAFFADCEHEVQKVRSGVRVCLTCNLILRPKGKPAAGSKSDGDPRLLQAIGESLKDFADELPNFDEPKLVGQFLQTLAQRDWTLKLDKFVLTSCKRMGVETISPQRKRRARSLLEKIGVIICRVYFARGSWMLRRSSIARHDPMHCS